jgi:1-acyl-sn-glycerol-3-phosphate acyltransferase
MKIHYALLVNALAILPCGSDESNIPVMNNVFQRAVKAIVWVVIRFFYRVRVEGMKNIPATGPAILIPNHVSYLDAVLIAAHTKRPIRFAMYWKLYNATKWIVKPLGAFPIAPRKESREVHDAAFVTMSRTLQEGGLLCIFPEGMLTINGKLGAFFPGVTRVLADDPVPVIPVGLRNLWGSYFSKKKPGLFKLPEHFMAKITMKVGEPIKPGATLEEMRERVGMLVLMN